MLEGNDANHTPLRVRVSHQSREATAAWLTCDTDVAWLDVRTFFIKLGSTTSLLSVIVTRPCDYVSRLRGVEKTREPLDVIVLPPGGLRLHG